MFSITAGTKVDFHIDDKANGTAVAASSPNENGWFTASTEDGGEWLLNVAHVTAVYETYKATSLRDRVLDGIGERLTVDGSSLEGAKGLAAIRISEVTNLPVKAVETILTSLIDSGDVSTLNHHSTKWDFWT